MEHRPDVGTERALDIAVAAPKWRREPKRRKARKGNQ